MEKTAIEMYYRDMSTYARSKKHEKVSFKKAKTDKSMFNRIVKDNLGLVIKICQRYNGQGISFEDLIQEGNVGLIDSIYRFDETKGSFSVYSGYWIRHYIFMAFHKKRRLIRLPVNKEKDIMWFKKAKDNLRSVLGREPTKDEIVSRINIKREYIDILEHISAYKHITYDSFNGVDQEDIPDISNCMESKLNSAFIQDTLNNIFKKIQPRDAKIVKMFHGICDVQKESIRDIASTFQITSSRVRQIEKDFSDMIKARYPHLKSFI